MGEVNIREGREVRGMGIVQRDLMGMVIDISLNREGHKRYWEGIGCMPLLVRLSMSMFITPTCSQTLACKQARCIRQLESRIRTLVTRLI